MSPLIQKYLKFAILHEEYTLNGDYKNGNKVHKEIMKTIDKLKFENQKVKKEFYTLLNYDNDSVKIWTSSFLIATFEEKCIEVLLEISKKNKTILSLNAETTLDVWKKGMLENLINWEK